MFEIGEAQPKQIATYKLPPLDPKYSAEQQICHAAMIDKNTPRLIVVDKVFFYVQSPEGGSYEMERGESPEFCRSIMLSQN